MTITNLLYFCALHCD